MELEFPDWKEMTEELWNSKLNRDGGIRLRGISRMSFFSA